MTRKKVGIACVVMLAVFCGFELFHQNGIVHTTRKNGYGCLCHGFNPSDTVRVWISGPDSLRPGEVGVYMIHVAKRSSIAAGFNVAAYRGSLGIVDSLGTQLMTETPGVDSLELTHTYPPRAASGRDTISWVFSFKAPPMVGFVDTLYAVGNSVDLDATPDGDAWNFSPNFRVRVVPPTSVAEHARARSFRLLQNYPNPFNPVTRIPFIIDEGALVSLKVYDMIGKEITTLMNEVKAAGAYTVEFSGNGLSSGIYFYQLKAGGVTLAKKMVLLR